MSKENKANKNTEITEHSGCTCGGKDCQKGTDERIASALERIATCMEKRAMPIPSGIMHVAELEPCRTSGGLDEVTMELLKGWIKNKIRKNNEKICKKLRNLEEIIKAQGGAIDGCAENLNAINEFIENLMAALNDDDDDEDECENGWEE